MCFVSGDLFSETFLSMFLQFADRYSPLKNVKVILLSFGFVRNGTVEHGRKRNRLERTYIKGQRSPEKSVSTGDGL